MKWIKGRNKFLSEAKIKDVVFPRQAKQIVDEWGEKFLEYEEIEATPKIKQGTWKLSEEDKRNVLGVFFNTRMDKVYAVFEALSEKFVEVFPKSINVELIGPDKREIWRRTLETMNVKSPSLDQICLLYENAFRKIAVAETQATEYIKKDENGKPVIDKETGKMIKIQKEKGEVVFTNNLVNINTFIADFNRCYPDDKVQASSFLEGDVSSIRNVTAVDTSAGKYKFDFELFGKDMNLTIIHKPKDILNMSISKFYASCQHLYTGGYKNQVLGNVFDPNSIPAYLRFETPIMWEGEAISDFVPIARVMVRNIETFDNKAKEPLIYFDRCYPDKLESTIGEIIRRYSGNINNVKDNDRRYLWAPDVDERDKRDLSEPYMDRLGLEKGNYIGTNTKVLYLSASQDWSKTIISPKAKIKELIVETTDIPANMFDVPFDLDWVKFKFINIKSLASFNIKTSSWAFEKCKLNSQSLSDIIKSNPNIKKLQVLACDINGIDLTKFTNLEELQLIYSLDESSSLESILKDISFKKLVISGDVLSNVENKKFINSLKQKGVKVQIEGLVI